MFIRVTWIEGEPEQLERGIASFQPQVVAPFRDVPGFLGAILLADRQGSRAAAVTYWENQQALDASEARANGTRSQAADSSGVRVRDVERYEVVLQDRSAPPQAHTFIRVNNIRGSADKVDDGIRFVRERVAPLLKGQNGFRAVLLCVNRQNGRSLVASVWDSAADRDASESAAGPMRQEGTRLVGGSDTAVELYESVFSEVKGAAAGEEETATAASRLLDEWVRTFVEERYEDGERLFAPDAVAEEIGTGRQLSVREGTENAKAWKAAFPDAQGRVENRVVAGRQVAAEIVWTGTNTGSLNGMPPTGRRVTMRAVAILEEEGGRIARLRHYIDLAGMLSQLGAMPAAAQATGTAASA